MSDLLYRRPPQDADSPVPGRSGRLADRPEAHDLLYRFKGSPAEAKARDRSLLQNVADVHGAEPPLAASADALAQKGGPQPGAGPAQPRDPNAPPQQPTPAAPAPSPANATSKQSAQNVETPYNDLKDYLKKSRNPLFIKDFYDHRTPLEEKLRLRQFILSLRAPEGEKLPLYIMHLQNWFNAKNRPPVDQEKPVEYALKDLMKFPVVPEGLNKVLNFFGTEEDKKELGKKTIFEWLRAHPDATKPGGVNVPDTHWETVVEGLLPLLQGGAFGLPKPGSEEYFYAFGGAPMTATSSGIKGFVDKNGAVTFRGKFNVLLHDIYDWNIGQGTPLKPSPKIPMDKLRRYIPKDLPVIPPKADEIQVSDSFFKELLEKGYGRDFEIKAPHETLTLEFYQAKPGGPFSIRQIPPAP